MINDEIKIKTMDELAILIVKKVHSAIFHVSNVKFSVTDDFLFGYEIKANNGVRYRILEDNLQEFTEYTYKYINVRQFHLDVYIQNKSGIYVNAATIIELNTSSITPQDILKIGHDYSSTCSQKMFKMKVIERALMSKAALNGYMILKNNVPTESDYSKCFVQAYGLTPIFSEIEKNFNPRIWMVSFAYQIIEEYGLTIGQPYNYRRAKTTTKRTKDYFKRKAFWAKARQKL